MWKMSFVEFLLFTLRVESLWEFGNAAHKVKFSLMVGFQCYLIIFRNVDITYRCVVKHTRFKIYDRSQNIIYEVCSIDQGKKY